MIAAGRVAEDAMSDAIRQASEMRPQKVLLTEGQRRAWRRLAKEFGDDVASLTTPSARAIAEAGVQAMIVEAESLMQNPAVQDAYEQFQAVCKLVKLENS
jgi:Cdc6-like AAA superfamily ATPase